MSEFEPVFEHVWEVLRNSEMSQKSIAEKSGLSESVVSKFLSKKTSPAVTTLARLARTAGLNFVSVVERCGCNDVPTSISVGVSLGEFAKLMDIANSQSDSDLRSIPALLRQSGVDELLRTYEESRIAARKRGRAIEFVLEMFTDFPGSTTYWAGSDFELFDDLRIAEVCSRLAESNGAVYAVYFALGADRGGESHFLSKCKDFGFIGLINNKDSLPKSFIANTEAKAEYYAYAGQESGVLESASRIAADLKLFEKVTHLEHIQIAHADQIAKSGVKTRLLKSLERDLQRLSERYDRQDMLAHIPPGFVSAYRSLLEEEEGELYITSLLTEQYHKNIELMRKQASEYGAKYTIEKRFHQRLATQIIYFGNCAFGELNSPQLSILNHYDSMKGASRLTVHYVRTDQIFPPLFTVNKAGTKGIIETINGAEVIEQFEQVGGARAAALKQQFEELLANAIEVFGSKPDSAP